MANFEPRPIVINSKTFLNFQFLSGFITFNNDNNNSVGAASLDDRTDPINPNLLYLEDTANKINGQIKPLTIFTFNSNQPSMYTVQFQNYRGVKYTKVKTSSSLGHQQPVDPRPSYLARPFILQDEVFEDNQAEIYSFLIDTYNNDTIAFDGDKKVSIHIGAGRTIITQMFSFSINTPYETLDLYLSNLPSLFGKIAFKDAPFYTYEADSKGAAPKACLV
jgi:hypothetical protein